LWSRGENLRLSFRDLDERVEARLAVLGSELVDRSPTALATGNCVAFVESYLALRRLGVTVVAMDGTLTTGDKVAMCRELGVRRLVLEDRTVAVAAHGEGREVHPSQGIGLVKLTSGSTGRPGGACFTDEVLCSGIRQIAEGMDLDARQRVLMCIPLSHSYGFDNGVLSLLVLGTPLILQPSIFPADLLRALDASQAHFLPLVPPLVRSLGRATWPEHLPLRTVICAGGALLPEAARQFRQVSGRAVHNFYGSTETGGICFETAPEDADAVGTVGWPLPGVRVELDVSGRVVVHSAANLVQRWPSDGVEAPGNPTPVRTGDTAEWTPEGRLRLTGRTADILNIGGRKIAAAEVEAALCALHGVRDAAVVGVDDPVRGDRTVAFLVADHWPLDTSELPPRLIPREMRQVESLPHTARGKLDRQALRRIACRRDVT
jgi:acyl-coenzyme A synthetase/AMP-(fatty) acid ligase